MKSLKKAMALMVACASIFGTVANAAFLNPIDSSPTMKQLVDSSASFTGSGGYYAGYYAGCRYEFYGKIHRILTSGNKYCRYASR